MLPDSKFIQDIAEKSPNVFEKLAEKLKEFVNGLKQYFGSPGGNRSREANALKEEINGEIHYPESIVKAFDKAAAAGVENYRSNNAVDETEETAEVLFKNSEHLTGVNTRLVTISKSDDTQYQSRDYLTGEDGNGTESKWREVGDSDRRLGRKQENADRETAIGSENSRGNETAGTESGGFGSGSKQISDSDSEGRLIDTEMLNRLKNSVIVDKFGYHVVGTD